MTKKGAAHAFCLHAPTHGHCVHAPTHGHCVHAPTHCHCVDGLGLGLGLGLGFIHEKGTSDQLPLPTVGMTSCISLSDFPLRPGKMDKKAVPDHASSERASYVHPPTTPTQKYTRISTQAHTRTHAHTHTLTAW